MSKKDKTAAVYLRCDIRDLATILRYYKKVDRHPGTRSKMLSLIVSDFANILTQTGEVEPCESHEQAYEETARYFDVGFTPTPNFVQKVKDERMLESLGGRVEEEVSNSVSDILGALHDDLD